MREINANTAASMSTLRQIDSLTIQRLARKYFPGSTNSGLRTMVLRCAQADLDPDASYGVVLDRLATVVALTATGKASLKALAAELDGAHSFRLVVGEAGNQCGHVVPCHAINRADAERALARAVGAYKGDGWGRVEELINGHWSR